MDKVTETRKPNSLKKMACVQMKRFILYRQRSVLCNVADIKHFGRKMWKSVFHKSHRPLYIVLYTHVEK